MHVQGPSNTGVALLALLYPFLDISPQFPFPAPSSCSLYSSADPSSSETLRFAFLPVAKSQVWLQFLDDLSISVTDEVVSYYCLHYVGLSGLYLSVLFVAPPFTCYSLSH